MKRVFVLLGLFVSLSLGAWEREAVWPEGKMPDRQSHQIAAMTNEVKAPGFKADDFRTAYLEWFEAPANPNGGCMILISGGAYQNCCDVGLIDYWHKQLSALGFQCVNFVYRTPRPKGLPIWQTAWEDGQRAVRMVRSEAAKRGFDPEKIGTISMSAGSHLALLLATSSQTPAYEPVDALDETPCHINWAIVNAPAYVTNDGENGSRSTREGYGTDVRLSSVFQFDEKTCPMSLHHGGLDVYSPNGSTLVYRQLRRMGIPAELHLYPGKGHGAFGFERGVEFMRQMDFLPALGPEEAIMDRFPGDEARGDYKKENVWPEGKTPDWRADQCTPYLEWHFPKERKTTAIQILYSGGSYTGNDPDGFEVAPARRYLNDKGMTVVTLKYRTPRPSGLAKHTTAWEDLQRAIRIVRAEAPSYGLDPDRIGIMGSSAGGHLTLMGVTSSRHQSYHPIDSLEKVSCKVQWGIGIYPAYSLTDGLEKPNAQGGNEDDAFLAPEFSFDLDTAPMLFIHGDKDGWASMNSVKAWEKMRAMGIQSELHTLALRPHCFQRKAAPGTGSYTWLDRIWEFLTDKGFNKAAAPESETYCFAERDTCSLYMDIFRASKGSATSLEGHAKPTILYVFGGGFILGKRADGFTRKWFKQLNDEGYNVVTIDYRLGMKGVKVGKGLVGSYKATDDFVRAEQMGVEDVFSAVTYLAENQKKLKIDPSNIVLAGSSAGAIITLAAVHQIASGTAVGLPEGFRFKGAISFAGGIISSSGAPEFVSEPCPILLLHGTADQAVAYKQLGALGNGIWGSDYLSDVLSKKGYPYCIYRFKDRTHDVASYHMAVWPIEKEFLEESVVLGKRRFIDATVDDPSLPSWGAISMAEIYK